MTLDKASLCGGGVRLSERLPGSGGTIQRREERDLQGEKLGQWEIGDEREVSRLNTPALAWTLTLSERERTLGGTHWVSAVH